MTDASTVSEESPGAAPSPPLPPDALIIVPVRGMVLFPGTVLPITLGRPRSVLAAQRAVREQKPVGIVMQRDAQLADPLPIDLHRMGTVANIVRYITAPDGTNHLICQGEQRFRVLDYLTGWPFFVARTERIPEPSANSDQIEARFVHLKGQAIEAIQLLPQAPNELLATIQGVDSPGALADLVATFMDVTPDEKQEILETVDIGARMERVSRLLAHRIEVLRLSQEIGRETRASLELRNREVLLREQMAAIQRQLGEADEGKSAEIAELEKAIANAHMPKEVDDQARKELRRLQRMPEAAGEYGMVRTYLDWLVDLPWALPEEAPIDIAAARRILDEDHFGLEKIKRRIIEYLAVRKLAPDSKAPILCFVGPPGVGKTSLGQSIARAMNRKFVRVSLGGVHDEAEIRGHRRTYIGALPGNIIQAIRKAGARNCVMMLDEIDKLGAGIQGDPASAMLEVLDPSRTTASATTTSGCRSTSAGSCSSPPRICSTRSPARFATAWKSSASPATRPAKSFRSRAATLSRVNWTPTASSRARSRSPMRPSEAIIEHYTREAGVRNLEREIGRVLRQAAMRIAEGETGPIAISAGDLSGIMGPPPFENEVAMRTSIPGVATGLAWTPVGGDILFIEATATPGNGRLILTGQLGEVMKESAQAALSIVKSSRRLIRNRRLPVREDRHPYPCAGGRDAQGWPERGRGDVHGARFASDRPHRGKRHRDDRRDKPQRIGAAGRRHQGEGHRRAPSRDPPRHAAGAQQTRLRRHPRRGASAIDVCLARAGGRCGVVGARAGRGSQKISSPNREGGGTKLKRAESK